MRESPAVKIIQLLKEKGLNVEIYDPHVNNDELVDFETAIKGADIILILTDHNEYKNMDFKVIENLRRRPVIFDTRNIVTEDENRNVKVINYGNIYKYKA